MWKFGFPGELSYFGNAVVIKSMSSFFLNNAIPIVLETILLFYSALHDTSTSRAMRSVDSLNAVGTIIHHSSASLAVSALLANGELSRVLLLVYLLLLFLLRRCYSTLSNIAVINPNRDVLQSILPLVMQHWFILLRYSHKMIYVLVETLLEIWFEWSLFSSLENVDNLHWIWGVLSISMVFAHW